MGLEVVYVFKGARQHRKAENFPRVRTGTEIANFLSCTYAGKSFRDYVKRIKYIQADRKGSIPLVERDRLHGSLWLSPRMKEIISIRGKELSP